MKLLSRARDLKRRKARDRHGEFVAEGIRSVEALLSSDLGITGLLLSDAVLSDRRVCSIRESALNRQIACVSVDEEDFASAADTESPQGVLAIGKIPRYSPESFVGNGSVLVLDAVQDPGNVGTMIRSAAALGISASIALPGTVDLWNAKVVRSSMGALFSHPVYSLSWEEAKSFLVRYNLPLWVAAMDGMPLREVLSERMGAVALVMSNEGSGVSAQVEAAASVRVAIPMMEGAESLNVGVAAGILFYELGPGSR